MYLGLPVTGDFVVDEVVLSRALDYEPMFMTDCAGLIFPWQIDETRSDEENEVSVIPTSRGEWVRTIPRRSGLYGDESCYPVQTEADHAMLVAVCEQAEDQTPKIRAYFRQWRERVGEDGVIVIGHPHASWLGYQIGPQTMFYHWHDYPMVFRRSMHAVYEAALIVMTIAMEEGIDFMSDSSYGLEMTSPELFQAMDLPTIRAYADWTHARGGLFWYHCCSRTRRLILDGVFNRLGADLIETIAPPPEGDNDLAESRGYIDASICTKGNLSLGLLREASPEQVAQATHRMVKAVRGHAHVFSTADAVLAGTPPQNLIAFVETAREAADSL
jgi:uroporphyrinogen-III decarboxylase